ncbi:DUF2510 domain-containing protein [Mycolicibacterium mucogenicum]|uniref:DUF2510 domain-containing protein n=1 Tax=Mycolicibacterium mucogenicum TaxID=56689 RepID=A0A4R5W7G6_MYCMU|nr:DUF2510 domain-containing protein [Mycolicibacterium mucogenicum]TDK84480.1 DUF2510 domain-containing protein [Mycolicibacterium mucogenicum]
MANPQPTGKRGRKPPPQSSAGWYPDPGGKDGERYWNGAQWTAKFVPMTMPVSTTQRVWKWIAITAAVLAFGGCTYLAFKPAEPGAPRTPSPTNVAPLTHGPQGHMTADPEPSACADAPVTSVRIINAGFLRPDEHLIDIQAVVAGSATYIGANIAGDRPEMGNKVSSQDLWAVYMGQVYAITSDARSRTTFPDGRHVAGLESWPEANAALGHCVGALERARNGER